jgi:tRNA A37 threonylcarbamoyladenosine dehydratase
MSIPQEHIRTAMLVGQEALSRYCGARVAVFGVGGVGGYVCEGLARAGIGALDLFDHDAVSLSNINRQIIALHSTVGQKKVDVMASRIADINPDCRVTAHQVFYLPENAHLYPLENYTYVADAIDTVTAKIELAVRAREAGVPLISSMGTGNKLDPTAFRVTDISKTKVCPLARAVRTRLRKIGINHLKVVYSEEEPHVTAADGERLPPASVSFVPGVAGLILAGQIIVDLTAEGKGSLDEG